VKAGKHEIRNPKSEGNPKPEIRNPKEVRPQRMNEPEASATGTVNEPRTSVSGPMFDRPDDSAFGERPGVRA